MQQLCGIIPRAYTCTQLVALQKKRGKINEHAKTGHKLLKKQKMLKNPLLSIHHGSREIMHLGGVLLLKQKGLWFPAILFCVLG
jgi:hypothetical protein